MTREVLRNDSILEFQYKEPNRIRAELRWGTEFFKEILLHPLSYSEVQMDNQTHTVKVTRIPVI